MTIKLLHEDDRLLKGIAAGDQHALKMIYDHYHQRVYTFALWYLKSEEDAEDVTQEVFLKLWFQAGAAAEIQNLEKYLRAITANRALDVLRYQARRLKTTSISEEEDSHPAHNETEESIILKDFREILQRGVQSLPEQQRLVYQLCKEQGLKNDEAAAQLALSPHTVRTHMKLAIRFLKEYLRKNSDQVTLLAVLSILTKLEL